MRLWWIEKFFELRQHGALVSTIFGTDISQLAAIGLITVNCNSNGVTSSK